MSIFDAVQGISRKSPVLIPFLLSHLHAPLLTVYTNNLCKCTCRAVFTRAACTVAHISKRTPPSRQVKCKSSAMLLSGGASLNEARHAHHHSTQISEPREINKAKPQAKPSERPIVTSQIRRSMGSGQERG